MTARTLPASLQMPAAPCIALFGRRTNVTKSDAFDLVRAHRKAAGSPVKRPSPCAIAIFILMPGGSAAVSAQREGRCGELDFEDLALEMA